MVTDGYKYLMGEIKMTYGDNDPWGTTMGWLFGLARVAWVEFDETLSGFLPPPLLHSRDDLHDTYPEVRILEMVIDGDVNAEDIRTVFKVMSRYDDILRAAGLNY